MASDKSELLEFPESAVLGLPPVDIGGLESFHRKRSIDDGPGFRQGSDRTGRQHLHGDVAERGRFDRSGDDQCGPWRWR